MSKYYTLEVRDPRKPKGNRILQLSAHVNVDDMLKAFRELASKLEVGCKIVFERKE